MNFSIDHLSHDKKTAYALFFGVLIIASFFYLWHLNKFPLADYDEATYAQVTHDTLASNDIWTLKKFDQNWFEKPPLYFWLAMASTSIFGTDDFVYRLPSALMAILGIALLWLLVKKLTADSIVATASAVALLVFSFYFISAREARLDVPAITMIIASLTALVYGWGQRKILSWVAPAIALGFLFKSFLVFFALPALLIFSLFYKKFKWLSDRYFWLGAILALVILVPWHWAQYSLWGSTFVNQYFGLHVLERFSAGLTINPSDPFDYFRLLNIYGQPWVSLFVIFVLMAFWYYFKKRETAKGRLLWASGLTAMIIFGIVFFGKTRILTYILPIFPFIAMVVGAGFVWLIKIFKNIFWRVAILILFIACLIYSMQMATGVNAKIIDRTHQVFDADEKNIGIIVGQYKSANLYLLGWPFHESLRYYSGRDIIFIPVPLENDIELIAPWYILVPQQGLPYFFNSDGSVKEYFAEAKDYYHQNGLFLFFGKHNIVVSP